MSRMSSDITEVRNSMVSSFSGMIKYPIFITVYFIGLLFISWQMTIIITLLLPITAIITGSIGKSLKKTSEKAQILQGDILVFIDETLSGLKIIKLFHYMLSLDFRITKDYLCNTWFVYTPFCGYNASYFAYTIVR